MSLDTVNKKLVAIGDGACGKTSLLVRFSKREFPVGYQPTIFDSYVAQITLGSTIVKLSLFDTAGEFTEPETVKQKLFSFRKSFLSTNLTKITTGHSLMSE